ncbi:MAG: DUF308 domain-containing protein [Clostridiales bacterium]|nr:DUF308 domain-containing protein [Clostridiales bacterium]
MDLKAIKRIPSYIGGLFVIIAGAIFILYPEVSSSSIGLMFGAIMIVSGITEVIGYVISIRDLKKEAYGKAAGAEISFVYSLVLIAVGIYIVIEPSYVLPLLTTFTGLYFLIDGIVKLRRELFVFDKKDSGSIVIAMMSGLLIVGGILLLCNVFYGTRNVIVFTGLSLIVSGLDTLCMEIMKKDEKKTRK